MPQLPPDDLLLHFHRNSNRFTNSTGMLMGRSEDGLLWTYYTLSDHSWGPLAISISTEGDDAEEFIAGFRLQTLADLDQLAYNNSWMRYLNGAAQISVSPIELEASVEFRILRQKTIVFSLDLHFYDEVYEHLTLPEDFERYLTLNERILQVASDNRNKFYRSKWEC